MIRTSWMAFLGCLIVFGSTALPVRAGMGPCDEGSGRPATASFDVHSRTPLYGFSDSGSFYLTDFNGSDVRLLSKHAFESSIEYTRSADGRLLAYTGGLKIGYERSLANHRVDQTWLYDLATHKHALVLESPAWSLAGVKSSFSPDSKWLATTVDPDRRHPAFKRLGLVLVSTATWKFKHLGYPPGIDPLTVDYSSVSWRADGQLALFYVRDSGGEGYFELDPLTGKFKRIEGRYNDKQHERVYVSAKREIAQQVEYWPQSRIGFSTSRTSSDAQGARARIDDKYTLWVQRGTRPERLVASGVYEQCGGVTIAIKGWLDGGDYLVYSISQAPYIIDTATMMQKPLKLGPIGDMNYFW